MTITIDIISLPIIFATAVGLTLCFVLWANQTGNRVAHCYLSALLLLECTLSVTHLVIFEWAVDREKLLTVMSLQVCIGPMLLFYVNSVTQNEYRWTHKNAFHFVPAIILAGVWLLQINGWAPMLSDPDSPVYDSRRLHRFSAWLSLIIYASWSMRVLAKHQIAVKDVYSSIEDINLKWLRTILVSVFILVLIAIFLDIRYYLSVDGTGFVGGRLQALSPLFLAILMGWFGLRQKMFSLEDEGDQVESAPDQNGYSQKYRTSSLTENAASQIWSNLLAVMQQQQPYLENGLKISVLSKELGVSVNHLSETINGYANQSFYDFINKYRVEEAERLLADKSVDYLSVTDIGFQAGFNSDSTFFTHFKRLTGVTPKLYRKKCGRG